MRANLQTQFSSSAPSPQTRQPPSRPLRLWPAAVIVALQLSVQWVYSTFASTNVQSGIELGLIPLAGAILLSIWWLAVSRARWLDRVLGYTLFLAAIAGVVASQANASYGAMLLAYAVPAMTTGIVLVLLVTTWLRWPIRRWLVAAYMVGCCAMHLAMRFESVGGNLAPEVSWRWQPSRMERSDAMERREAHGTATLPAQAGPGDYPAFRGPARDGCLGGTRFSSDWSTPPPDLWRREMGPGWSSFIAVGDYLFTQEQRGPNEVVTCYRAATGEEVWTNKVVALFEDAMGLGPRATPTFDQGKLYTQGATGLLQCLDAATGSRLWQHDLKLDAGCKTPRYGFVGSPLVVGELVVVFTGGPEGKGAIAYHRASGDIAWVSGHKSTIYSSPHPVRIGDTSQILMNGEWGLQSLDGKTGAPLWEYPWNRKAFGIGTQPVVLGNTFLIGSTGSTGSRLIKVENNDAQWLATQEFATQAFHPYFNNSVAHQGYCYGYDDQRLACISMKTGQLQWEGEKCGGQLLLLADMDLLLVLTEKGQVLLVKAVPERCTEVARFQAIKGKTWNHPIIAHGKLFVRNSEEAACFQLN